LAQWLASRDNPLTARVMVNRLWQSHFGSGLVSTPNDFGKNGQPPTHPELLDWLANRFSERWSLKEMHRLMVTSAAYRQSSAGRKDGQRLDPDNRLLWRANRRRLDAEELRDAVLQIAGTLNPRRGGPSVRVPLEPEVYDTIFTEGEPDHLWSATPDPNEHRRRSLYLLRKRNVRLPMFALFDQPDMMSACGTRGSSVHALQSLTLLNGPFMQEQARAFAARLASASPDAAVRIGLLFHLTFGRPPGPDELAQTTQFVGDGAQANWVDLCLATFNRNDFLYLR
jgi:hypothetical protein